MNTQTDPTIAIVAHIRNQVRGLMDGVIEGADPHCNRNFSEPRANGRRLKFWGIKHEQERKWVYAARAVLEQLAPGLEACGYRTRVSIVDAEQRSYGYGAKSLVIHLIRTR